MGVARQYCGRLGKVANCQAGMFLAYVSPLGRALVERAVSARELDIGSGPLCGGGCARGAGATGRSGVGLGTVGASLGLGRMGCRGDAFGMSPSFRESLAALGMPAGRSGRHSGLALGAFVDQLSGVRAPPQAQAGGRTASYHGAAQ